MCIFHTQVGTNGYFTFEFFTGFSPFLFNNNTNLSLVAPFFTDIDISDGVGRINYEVHTEFTSEIILTEVNAIINEHTQANFTGFWLLVASWEDVPPFGDSSIVRIPFYTTI